MIKKVELGSSGHHGVFGNPAPLGLLGLAVSCAALTPVAFGYGLDSNGHPIPCVFFTTGVFLLLFGFATHLITGIMDFANKNAYGGTIFSAFAFNWLAGSIGNFAVAFNYHLDHNIILATEVVLMAIFIFLTYGFGFFSKALFFFLLDIDLLFICKLAKGFSKSHIFDMPIAIFTIILGLIGLWLALGGLINPITGKEFFPVGRPVFSVPKTRFDFAVRQSISNFLYIHWQKEAYKEMNFETLKEKVKEATNIENISPDLFYLEEYGTIHMTLDDKDEHKIKSLRLTAGGIDLHEQLVLKKYEF